MKYVLAKNWESGNIESVTKNEHFNYFVHSSILFRDHLGWKHLMSLVNMQKKRLDMKLQFQIDKFGYCSIKIKRKYITAAFRKTNFYYSLTCSLSKYLLPDKTI